MGLIGLCLDFIHFVIQVTEKLPMRMNRIREFFYVRVFVFCAGDGRLYQ